MEDQQLGHIEREYLSCPLCESPKQKLLLASVRVLAVVSMGCPVIKNYVSGIRSVDSNQAPECLNVKTPGGWGGKN